MARIAGVLSLLIGLYIALYFADPNAFRRGNLIDVTNRQGFYGVITLGVAVLIITGAIDLSIGSVIGLSAVVFGQLMHRGMNPFVAMGAVLTGGVVIGLFHGLLVTRLKLQAFLVTLCGLFIYRGLARYYVDRPVGLANIQRDQPSSAEPIRFLRAALIGKGENSVLNYPAQMFVLLALAALVGLILHKSVVGRYWYAIGYNESAARYSGIATNRYKLIGFVLSSFLASLGGVMMLLDVGTA